jgi:8-oxo-dGTP diphosphatase
MSGSEEEWTPPLMAITVDLVVLTVRGERLHVLLVERGIEPYLGRLALPGGFVAAEENLDDAAERELAEETGLTARGLHLEQVRTYGSPERDPRMRVVTISYLALMPDLPLPHPGGDARGAQWMPADAVLAEPATLAFDHHTILSHAIERARGKLEYTTLAAAFCGEEFTVSELRRVYEIVWSQQLDHRNFHRKITRSEDFLMPTGARTTRDGGRPAALYRRGTASLLHPPLLRSRANA